jgi:hypothetical protein
VYVSAWAMTEKVASRSRRGSLMSESTSSAIWRGAQVVELEKNLEQDVLDCWS